MTNNRPSEAARDFSLLSPDGTRVTKEGIEALSRWMPDMKRAFSAEGREHATWPKSDHPLSVFDDYSNRPPEAIGMANALAKDLVAFERSGELLGRRPFAWQVGVTKWLVFSLLNGGSSYLIESAPGAGKTLVLGEVVRSAIESGMFDSKRKIVLVFNKPHIATQQMFHQRDRVHRFGRSTGQDGGHEGLVGMEIQAGGGTRQFLPLPSEHEVQQRLGGLTGDMTRGIPAEMWKEGKVVMGMKNVSLGGGVEVPVLDEKNVDDAVAVVCTQQMLHVNDAVKKAMAQAGLVVIDDSRRGANVYAEQCMNARASLNGDGRRRPPLVVMASALSETNGPQSRPFADAYSPKLTTLDAMETDSMGRRVSPDIGIDISPRDAGRLLYPSDSDESIARLVETHFDSLESEEKLALPRSFEQDTFVVVERKNVERVSAAIREAYVSRNLPATVVPFAVNALSNKEQQLRRQQILSWAVIPFSDEEKKKFGPKIIVIPPTEFADALSVPFPNAVIMGNILSHGTMGRRIGRLGHVSGEGHPEGFRVTMRVILTSETKDTPFSFLAEGSKETFVPLEILRGSTGAKNDARKMRGLTTYAIPTKADIQRWPRREAADANEHSAESEETRANALQELSSKAEKLRGAAGSIDLRRWTGDVSVRAHFQTLIINELWPIVQKLHRKISRDAWTPVVVRETSQAWEDPMDMVDKMERYLTSSHRKAGDRNEATEEKDLQVGETRGNGPLDPDLLSDAFETDDDEWPDDEFAFETADDE